MRWSTAAHTDVIAVQVNVHVMQSCEKLDVGRLVRKNVFSDNLHRNVLVALQALDALDSYI